jgi:hypothetical protein
MFLLLDLAIKAMDLVKQNWGELVEQIGLHSLIHSHQQVRTNLGKSCFSQAKQRRAKESSAGDRP